LANLSKREVDVLELLVRGYTNSEIGSELCISKSTVAHHLTNILAKTGSSNRTEAAALASRVGLKLTTSTE
jgi:LuxR family maltose regulon positive regulatory protein